MTNIIGYTWCQYTPYFNDGDSCTFGIGEIYVTTNDEINPDMDNDSIIDFIESNYETTIDDFEYNENIDKDSFVKVTQMLFSLIYDKSIALNTFGDHTQITVYQSTDGDIKLESKYFEHD